MYLLWAGYVCTRNLAHWRVWKEKEKKESKRKKGIQNETEEEKKGRKTNYGYEKC